MKKLVLIIAAVVLGIPNIQAATNENSLATNFVRGYGNSFIFVEDGVTFSVFPDGEFDFYMDSRVNVGVGAQIGNVGITFNSGYNYNPFVQYDDYGAVIQVENIPIFYDYYGRVSQIGNVDIWYNNGRLRRIGGLHIYYNRGVFSHYTGFINVYNRYYVYRPFHRYFARPAIGFCNVYTSPYRRYYSPVRYTYYAPYRYNERRAYARVGKVYRNENRYRRDNIYRNDKRVSVRDNNSYRRGDSGRSNRYVEQNTFRKGNAVTRSDNSVKRQNNGTKAVRRSEYKRTENVSRPNRTVTQNKVTRTPNSRSVTQRKVTTTPDSRTVTRTTKSTYNRPQTPNRSTKDRSVVSRGNDSKKTVSRTSRSTVSRSTGNVRKSSSARTAESRGSRGSRGN